MKYIRTKDGRIYKAKHFYWHNVKVQNKLNITLRIERKDIIKQAETIEELCDEFIRIEKCLDIKPQVLRTEESEIIDLIGNANIYGAIWTDKGLIYVAKMNEKGELELL